MKCIIFLFYFIYRTYSNVFKAQRVAKQAEAYEKEELRQRLYDEQQKEEVFNVKTETNKPKSTFDMFSDEMDLSCEVLSNATLAQHDSTNMALKDNWDDVEGYYRMSLNKHRKKGG